MKLCIICGEPIVGKARKYCKKCKRDEHLEQMHQYYIINQNKWQENGIYFKNRKGIQLVGTGSLGSKSTLDWKKEFEAIQCEMRNLQLRTRKENWLYKND